MEEDDDGETKRPSTFPSPVEEMQLYNLVRRIRLLLPFYEELRGGSGEPLSEEAVKSIQAFKEAMRASNTVLLKLGSGKLQLPERDKIFQGINIKFEQALRMVPFVKLGISDELREQVELVHAQFKRENDCINRSDTKSCSDLSIACDNIDMDVDDDILKVLAEKLQPVTRADLTQESLALHDMVCVDDNAVPGKNADNMSMLSKKIDQYVDAQNPQMGQSTQAKCLPPRNVKPPVIPDDFRCPITLELMKDPVIVSTGQTYERESIEIWLASGHGTCPKTQQWLSSKSLIPNIALRSLISQWCEDNGLEPPKCPANTLSSMAPSALISGELANFGALLSQLASPNIEDQRTAAGQLCILTKCSFDNRICIGRAGAIPLLVSLLSTLDPGTQEHAINALLNLSMCMENKICIVKSNGVPWIIHVLWKGSMEAREDAAAVLNSLSVIGENIEIIGDCGAIPVLALLLNEGTHRGKKTAVSALFNLCTIKENKLRAVRAGVIPPLMELLEEPSLGLVNEALGVVALLASYSLGADAIEPAQVPVLVELIGAGSPRNKEDAASILMNLLTREKRYMHFIMARHYGVIDLLQDLALNGTERGKRKAQYLFKQIRSLTASLYELPWPGTE